MNLEATATAALQAVSLGSITPGEDSVFGRLCQFGDMAISCLSHQMANLVLKRRDTALNRIYKFVGPESALTLRNGPLLGSASLFPRDQVDATVDKMCQG